MTGSFWHRLVHRSHRQQCPKCGKDIDDHGRYCESCGYAIVRQSHEKLFPRL